LHYLIERGDEINIKDDNDCSPLLYYCEKNNNFSIIKYLVERGADINVGSNYGKYSLLELCKKDKDRSNSEIIK
jgi:ankyrin repeat protein